MIKRCVLGLMVLMVASCATRSGPRAQISLAELASLNQAKLAHVSIGMRKEELVILMGSNTAETRDGIVNNPWTAEGFATDSGARYEVLYYVTRPNPPFTPVRKSLTTPIVLKDDKVVGWGEDALKRATNSGN